MIYFFLLTAPLHSKSDAYIILETKAAYIYLTIKNNFIGQLTTSGIPNHNKMLV